MHDKETSMSVKIRLSRGGTKKRPYFYIVVAEAGSPRDGRYIEQIGTHTIRCCPRTTPIASSSTSSG